MVHWIGMDTVNIDILRTAAWCMYDSAHIGF